MKSLGQAQIQYDWCPYTRKGDEDRRVCIQRKDHAKTEGEGGLPRAKERGPGRNQPCPPWAWTSNLRTVRKSISVLCYGSPRKRIHQLTVRDILSSGSHSPPLHPHVCGGNGKGPASWKNFLVSERVWVPELSQVNHSTHPAQHPPLEFFLPVMKVGRFSLCLCAGTHISGASVIS